MAKQKASAQQQPESEVAPTTPPHQATTRRCASRPEHPAHAVAARDATPGSPARIPSPSTPAAATTQMFNERGNCPMEDDDEGHPVPAGQA
eukprot:1443426-Heterocapsa_arctica.AAC.1